MTFVINETGFCDTQTGLSITDVPQNTPPFNSITTLIPTAVIPDLWPVIEGRIAASLRYAGETYRLDDVRAALAAGEWQLWGDGVSVICTRVAEYPGSRTLFVMLASGELAGIKAMWPTLATFGRANGCDHMTGYARPGWRRSGGLPDGWKHVKDVIAVEL